ncbi:MAG: discoidin domain-containing protein [Desulfitobacteriaceae bacterium]
MVELGIKQVVLNWEAAYARAYSIQVSNDAVNWTTVYSTSTGDGGIDDITGLSASGRYVRMYGTQLPPMVIRSGNSVSIKVIV